MRDFFVTAIWTMVFVATLFGVALLMGCSSATRIATYCIENPHKCD
jgi:hypothetical protein